MVGWPTIGGMSTDAGGLTQAFLSTHFPGLPWPADAAARLAPGVRLRRFAAGAVVLAQGQVSPALFGVLSGGLRIQLVAADGGVSVVEHTPPGRLFGLSSFATGLPTRYEAQAREATRLLAIGPTAYAWLMDELPGFGRALTAELARRHDGTLGLLAAARHQGAMERLSLALAQLRREQPEAPQDAQGAVGLATTQADLARLAGLTRQTVNSLLAELARAGRVRPAYRRLWWGPG